MSALCAASVRRWIVSYSHCPGVTPERSTRTRTSGSGQLKALAAVGNDTTAFGETGDHRGDGNRVGWATRRFEVCCGKGLRCAARTAALTCILSAPENLTNRRWTACQ